MKDKLKHFLSLKKLSKLLKMNENRTRYLMVIGLIGLLLLIISKVFSPVPTDPIGTYDLPVDTHETTADSKDVVENTETLITSVIELEESYEQELENLLNKIKGVSDAEVMINLDSTNVKIYDRNLIVGQQTTDETDKSGGIRKVEDQTEETEVVLVRQGEKDVPLLVQTKKPTVRGVFIVAKGVDHATVKMWVLDSVSRLLDVPPHRVSVIPKK